MQLVGLIALIASAVIGNIVHAQTAPQPLRLTLECQQGSELIVRYTLQNVSPTPTAGVIGIVLGNDRTYVPQNLVLIVRRPGAADTNLDYPSVAAVAGRIDPWLVALPPEASYSVAIPARHFLKDIQEPAQLQLRLKTQPLGSLNPDMQSLRFVRVWTGTLTSNWIQFVGNCRR